MNCRCNTAGCNDDYSGNGKPFIAGNNPPHGKRNNSKVTCFVRLPHPEQACCDITKKYDYCQYMNQFKQQIDIHRGLFF
jgi:hypothetical protein